MKGDTPRTCLRGDFISAKTSRIASRGEKPKGSAEARARDSLFLHQNVCNHRWNRQRRFRGRLVKKLFVKNIDSKQIDAFIWLKLRLFCIFKICILIFIRAKMRSRLLKLAIMRAQLILRFDYFFVSRDSFLRAYRRGKSTHLYSESRRQHSVVRNRWQHNRG